MTGLERSRLLALDRCLHLLENALLDGRGRIDADLANRLRTLLGHADLVPNHRLEGRRTERVLDDIFDLQALVMGVGEEERIEA